MGGYQSIKRALGESNLERKFLWLFGVSITLLIVIAFLSVWTIAWRLIENTANHKGRDLVRVELFNIHWKFWSEEKHEIARQQMAEALAQESYDAVIMKLDPTPEAALARTEIFVPDSEYERALLAELMREATAKFSQPKGPGEPNSEGAAPPVVSKAVVGENDKHYYYQVIYWSQSCINCHEGFYGNFAESAATRDGGVFDPRRTPFRVVRVSMPYGETRTAIHRTIAVLFTVGLVTVFLSIVAFHYVVKYIVIKPLTHLRDVSDAVAEGDLAQRAVIKTRDEFEHLAESFNKMLRHLVETQAELRGANEELDGKVDELARLNMQLHEVNRLKGEFLANMSHELRTPLNSIIGFSEVLQNLEALNDKQKRYAHNIQKSGRNLLEMINDILDLAKMEAGKMDVRLSEFRIENIIHAQCEMVRNAAEDKNIDLTAEFVGDLPHLYQDQAKVQQILTNLLSNAIKFTPEGGRITVGAKGDGSGRIEFWVSDTGVGVSAAEQEIIFEKFRQGQAVLGQDNLTREYSGTGLGLSIVKELCKLLGGEVTVESELGRGSTFRVVLPWMRTDQPAAASRLNAKLDELSRPRRQDFLRGDTPVEAAPTNGESS